MDITIASPPERHAHVPHGQGKRLRVMADIVEVKVAEDETDDRYTVFEVVSPPGGGAALLHTHPPQETFVILEGRYAFTGLGPDGVYTLHAEPGATVHIGPGEPHGFRNVGDVDGRVLVIYAPPGEMRGFFEAMHAAVDHSDPLHAPDEALPGPDRIAAIFREHDMVILPGAPIGGATA